MAADGRATARHWRIASGAGIILVGGFCAGTFALAQDGDAGGLFAGIDFSAGLVAETGNAASEDITARAGLSFGFDSITRAQVFGFRAGTDLEVGRTGADLVRPKASFSYLRAARATDLSFETAYSETDLEDIRLDEIDADADGEIIADAGRRASASVSLQLITGKEAPFGTDTRLSWSRRDYAGTTDPDLYASTTFRADTTLRFDVTQTVGLRLTAGLERREDEDELRTNRRTTRFGAGADLQIDRAWSVTGDARATTITIERDPLVPGPRVLTEAEGLDLALQLSREMANGNLTFGLRREVEVTGRRTTFDIGRSLTLPEGDLAATLGVVRFDNGQTAPVATLALTTALTPTARVNASLSRSADVSDEDEDIMRTRLSLGYEQQINDVSRWTASIGVADTDVRGEAGDQRRIDLSLGYRRSLTEDWDLATGLTHRRTFEDSARLDSITTLTLNVERSFTFRP